MAQSLLAMQAGALRHVIALAEHHDTSQSIVDAANDALKTLEFLSEYQGIIKAAIKLQRSEPTLAALFTAWPDATIIHLTDTENV